MEEKQKQQREVSEEVRKQILAELEKLCQKKRGYFTLWADDCSYMVDVRYHGGWKETDGESFECDCGDCGYFDFPKEIKLKIKKLISDKNKAQKKIWEKVNAAWDKVEFPELSEPYKGQNVHDFGIVCKEIPDIVDSSAVYCLVKGCASRNRPAYDVKSCDDFPGGKCTTFFRCAHGHLNVVIHKRDNQKEKTWDEADKL